MRTKKPNLTELVTKVCGQNTPINRASYRPISTSSVGRAELRDVDSVDMGNALPIWRGSRGLNRQGHRKVRRYIESPKTSCSEQPAHPFDAREHGAEQEYLSCVKKLLRKQQLLEQSSTVDYQAEATQRIVRKERRRADWMSVPEVQVLMRKFARELMASILTRKIGSLSHDQKTVRAVRSLALDKKRKRLRRANS